MQVKNSENSKETKEKNIFFSYFISNKKYFILLIVGNIGVALSYVIWSLFMKGIADAIGSRSMDELLYLLKIGTIFLIFFYFINHFKEYARRKLLFLLNSQLREDVFNSVLSKDINTFNSENSAKFISILNNDISTIETDYFLNVPSMIENIVTATIATVALIVYHPLIAIIVVVFSLLPMIIPKVYGDILSESRIKLSNSLELYNTKIKDLFGGFELIKSFQIESQTRKLHNDATGNVEEKRYDFRRLYSKSLINQDILVYLGSIVQLCFSVYLVLKNQITFGVLMGSMQVSNYVANPLNQIGGQLLNLKSTKSIRSKIESILNNDHLISDKEELQKLKTATPINIKNLSFEYEENSKVLNDITLRFEGGKKYALVGSSGSGKSTLLKLIMNYYDDFQGDIILGDQSIKDVDKESFYQSFATIHQRTFVFDDTIKNNLTLYQNYGEDQISNVIERAGLNEFIERLPKGIYTNINEGGNNLSGGEQQRISIARALLKNSEVLLVDEATSSLDNALATKIEELILEQKSLTAIVVTHKLYERILKKYDCIIALRNGRVEEMGSFEELMKGQGYFYSLFTVNHE